MKKNISISIDEGTYKTFRVALDFSGQTEEEALMQSIHSYIAKVLGKVVNNFQAKSLQKRGEGNYTQKAKNRIPIWANRKNQCNHKIIEAYFTALDRYGKATLSNMEELCTSTFVKPMSPYSFKNNYASMKLDNGHSHGKIFEDDGNKVWIWKEIEPILMQYKDQFYTKKK